MVAFRASEYEANMDMRNGSLDERFEAAANKMKEIRLRAPFMLEKPTDTILMLLVQQQTDLAEAFEIILEAKARGL